MGLLNFEMFHVAILVLTLCLSNTQKQRILWLNIDVFVCMSGQQREQLS